VLREWSNLALTLAVPVSRSLWFANLVGTTSNPTAQDTHAQRISTLSAMGAGRLTPRLWIARQRGSGWLRQLRSQPLPAHTVLVAQLLTFVGAARLITVLVAGITVCRRGMRLTARQRATAVDLRWVGTTERGGLRMPEGILPRTLPRRLPQARRSYGAERSRGAGTLGGGAIS
jgi:hypothetical protein